MSSAPTQIFVFSGTGNSLHVARELGRRLPDSEVLPMVPHLRNRTLNVGAGVVGLVFPVHALTLPIAVLKFLHRLRFRRPAWVFSVATRGGTLFRGFTPMNRVLRRKGARLNARYLLDMPHNDPRGRDFRPAGDADILNVERNLVPVLDSIAASVAERRNVDALPPPTIELPFGPLKNRLIEYLVLAGMAIAPSIGGVQYFRHDERCTGCGICARICLSGKIAMMDGRPVWNRRTLCLMCYGCVNFCPVSSVQIDSIPGVESCTPGNGRYSHPWAKAGDMVIQKTGGRLS